MNAPLAIAQELSQRVGRLRFAAPVAYVYNPLEYAWAMHRGYIERYGERRRDVLLIGMNPGPWGMAQTGVPFGEVAIVRDWLGLDVPVEKPRPEHPKRPIQGLACARSEVSGKRLWGWAKERFATPEKFFSRFYVHNYCPLLFMEDSGRNFTPDKLPAAELKPLLEACDHALQRLVDYYRPKHIVGIGGFALKRAEAAVRGSDARFHLLLHPSPASPLANKGWAQWADKLLPSLS